MSLRRFQKKWWNASVTHFGLEIRIMNDGLKEKDLTVYICKVLWISECQTCTIVRIKCENNKNTVKMYKRIVVPILT